MATPGLLYGTIKANFSDVIRDDSDPGHEPQTVPVPDLELEVSPEVPAEWVPNTETGGLVRLLTKVARTDENGNFGFVPDQRDGDPPPTFQNGMMVVAYDSPGLAALLANGPWPYRIRLKENGTVKQTWRVLVAAGAEINLATATVVPSNPGQQIEPWLQAVQAAQAALDAVEAEADRVLDEMAVGVTDLGDVSGTVSVSQAESRSSVLKATLTGDTEFSFAPGLPGLSYTCTLLLAGQHTLSLPGVDAAYGVPLTLSGDDVVHVMWAGDRWIALSGAAALAVPGVWS